MFSLLLIFLSGSAIADPIQEFDFSSENIEYQTDGQLPQSHDVNTIIDSAGGFVAEILKDLRIENVDECTAFPSLNIKYLTWTELNKRRTDGEFGEAYAAFGNIRAMYLFDSEKSGSVIFISNSLKAHRQADITLSHEIAHYWWTRLCLGSQVKSMSAEEFAVEAGNMMAKQIALQDQ